MRVLLTGAGGFFGAHLARGIARLVPGAELLATDLASAPDAAVASFWGAGIRYLPLDVTNRANVRAVMDAFEPEIVVHAAAVTPDAAEAAADPERITAINVGGTFTVLDVATARPRMRRVIALSSAAVFGPPAHPGPVAESEAPDPRTLYGRTKVAVETIAARMAADRGVSVIAVRLTALYGEMERATPTRTRPSPIHLLATARPGARVAGPDVPRDWLHADDAAGALAALIAAPSLAHALYHVGGGEAVGWHRLIAAFAAAGRRFAWCDADEADFAVTEADARPVLGIARIAAETGFAPRAIEQGIAGLLA